MSLGTILPNYDPAADLSEQERALLFGPYFSEVFDGATRLIIPPAYHLAFRLMKRGNDGLVQRTGDHGEVYFDHPYKGTLVEYPPTAIVTVSRRWLFAPVEAELMQGLPFTMHFYACFLQFLTGRTGVRPARATSSDQYSRIERAGWLGMTFNDESIG